MMLRIALINSAGELDSALVDADRLGQTSLRAMVAQNPDFGSVLAVGDVIHIAAYDGDAPSPMAYRGGSTLFEIETDQVNDFIHAQTVRQALTRFADAHPECVSRMVLVRADDQESEWRLGQSILQHEEIE